MYSVEIDLHLIFEPPMTDNSCGVIVHRTIELPFVPANGLRVFSREWEDSPQPYGLELRDVTWDCDRQVFLAATSHICVDFPFASLAFDIRDWLHRGWHWWSYERRYENDDTSIKPRVRQLGDFDDPAEGVDDDVLEMLHTLPSEQRPPLFNNFFKAMIRHMASTYSNSDVAYAMDQTGRYLGENGHQSTDDVAVSEWHAKQHEWHQIPTDDHIKWMRKVEKHPSLESIVVGKTKRSKQNL